jgi:mannose-6-phosphate isomerase-like protein (cupin superfamily)
MKHLAPVALMAAIGGTILGCDYGRSATSGDPADASVACPESIHQASDGRTKSGYVQAFARGASAANDFRRVLYTARNLQLVQMTIAPGEHIGTQIHADQDQYFHIEDGHGEVQINAKRTAIVGATSIIVPAGAMHDVINTGDTPLRLLTIYGPPQHQRDTVRKSKADSDAAAEHFDGCLSE